MNENEHAEFSPSAADRWMTCTASHEEVKGKKENVSIDAIKGTAAHRVSARCLKENKNADAFRGHVEKVEENGQVYDVVITDEYADAIQIAIDEVRGIATKMGTKGGKLEYRVHITDDCYGTADVMMWNDGTLRVIDFKFGSGVPVYPDNNRQLMIYGVGGLMYLQKELKLTPHDVILTIIQPRIPYGINDWAVPRAQLVEFYKNDILPKITECKKGGVFMPSESACRWCPISPCAAALGEAVHGAENAFAALGGSEDLPKLPDIPETPAVLSIETMAKAYTYYPMIDKVFKDIFTRLFNAAESGQQVPGFKLVRGRSNRVWEDETKAEESLSKLAPDIELYVKKFKTAPAIEKELGKKRATEIQLDSMIVKPLGAITLVPESDKREAVLIEAEVEAAFAEVATPNGYGLAKEKAVTVESLFEGVAERAANPNVDVEAAFAEVGSETATGGNQELQQDQFVGDFESVNTEESKPAVKGSAMSALDKLLSGGNEEADAVVESMKSGERYLLTDKPPKKEVKAPGKNTKRFAVIEIGSGDFESVAKQIDSTPNSVESMVTWAHERDGYGIRVWSDSTFEIYK